MPVKKKVRNPLEMIVERDGSVTVALQVTHCSPDAVQYKPYSTTFAPVSPMYVRVTIPAAHVLWTDDKSVLLTPEGWYSIAKKIATDAMLVHVKN